MIVPLMTFEEMRKEFLHDYKMAIAIENNGLNKEVYELHKRHQTHAIQTKIWKSPLYNRWLLLYHISEEEVATSDVCITIDRRGLLRTLHAIGTHETDEVIIAEINIHFYKRYNERLRLGLTRPEQIVKHFFKHNPFEANARFSQLENEQQMNFFMPVKTGVVLGIRNEKIPFMEMKTFISNEMLRESQLEEAEFLRSYKEGDDDDLNVL